MIVLALIDFIFALALLLLKTALYVMVWPGLWLWRRVRRNQGLT